MTADSPDAPKWRLDIGRRMMTRCQADDDGYCDWADCPQLRDREPKATGRHCPWDAPADQERG